MSPEAALTKQIALYRAMTGPERLAVALRLHETACNVARAAIRAAKRDASDDEVERQLRLRLRLAYKR